MIRSRTGRSAAAAALVVVTSALVGCSGVSGTEVEDYLQVRQEYLTTVADIMALFRDAPWTAAVHERGCESADRFAPATMVRVELDAGENATEQGAASGWPEYSVPSGRQDALREQIAAIITEAGWFAQQWTDSDSGTAGVNLAASTGDHPSYQAELWVRFGVDGVSIRGQSSCMPGEPDALGDAAQDQPWPWDEVAFDTPVRYQDDVF